MTGSRGHKGWPDERYLPFATKYDAWTYVVQQGEDGPVKIGKSANIEARLKQLQTGSPHALVLLLALPVDLERDLQERFGDYRLSGEWFAADVVEPLLEYLVGSPAQREDVAAQIKESLNA